MDESISQPPRAYLHPDVILQIIVPTNRTEGLLQRAKDGEITLIISKYGLYEAFSALEATDAIAPQNVALMFKLAKIVDDDKDVPITAYNMSPERKAKLRRNAFTS